MSETLLYRNANEIASAIGRSRRQVPKLVHEEGLPAWQECPPTGPWQALPEDIKLWLRKRAHRFGVGKDLEEISN